MTVKLQKSIIVGSAQKPFRILSLSGGGMRGIYQSFFLHELSKSFPDKRLNKSFDLFIGTSTGAIVALAIALNKNLDVVTKMYESEGNNIFSKPPFWSQFLQGPLYNSNTLRKALAKVFGVQKLGECAGKVFVPATTLDPFAPRVFSNENDSDKELFVVDVLMASSAGPTYFQEVRPQDEARSYVDGGLWANTPSLIGVLKAHLAGVPLMAMRVLSVGNGETSLGITPNDFSKIKPTSGEAAKTVIDMMFAAQSESADVFTKALIGDGRHNVLKFVRINHSLREPIELNDVEKALQELKAPAEKDARDNRDKIEQLLSPDSLDFENNQEILMKTVGISEGAIRYWETVNKRGPIFTEIPKLSWPGVANFGGKGPGNSKI